MICPICSSEDLKPEHPIRWFSRKEKKVEVTFICNNCGAKIHVVGFIEWQKRKNPPGA